MNEQIKELAKEAQEYAEWSTPQGLEWFSTFKERFAWLIVRECAEVAAEHEALDIYEEIREHFGVKS